MNKTLINDKTNMSMIAFIILLSRNKYKFDLINNKNCNEYN